MLSILQRLLLALVLMPALVTAQWEPFKGPTDVQVVDIETLGDEIYAASDVGVFQSSDDGTSWLSVDEGLPGHVSYLDLVSTGDVVYVRTETPDGNQVLRSLNQGRTWTDVSSGLPGDVWDLIHINDVLFAIGSESGGYFDDIYRSLDRGDTWRRLSVPEVKSLVQIVVAAHGEYLLLFADKQVLRSTDLGDTWEVVSRGTFGEESWTAKKQAIPSEVEIYTVSTLGPDLYLGAIVREPEYEKPLRGGSYSCPVDCRSFEAIFRSTDDGNTWELLNWQQAPEDGTRVAIADFVTAESGDGLFIGAPEGAFRYSQRWGWGRHRDGLPAELGEQSLPLVSALAVLGGRVFAGTWDGVYFHNDAKDQWEKAGFGLPANTYIESLAVVEDALYASLGGQGIYRTIDQGAHWELVRRDSQVVPVRELSIAADMLFADTRHGIYRLKEAGPSWSAVKPYARSGPYPKIASSNGDLLLAAKHRIYRSSDDGQTWIDTQAPFYYATNCFFVDGQVLFLCPWERDLWRSLDGGKTWNTGKAIPERGERKTFWYPTKFDDKVFFSDYDAIYMSDDKGDTWVTVNEGLPPPPLLLEASTDRAESPRAGMPPLYNVQDSLFVATKAGVLLFDQSTESWVSVNQGLPPGQLLELDGSSAYLFAHVQGKGIWRLSPGQLKDD